MRPAGAEAALPEFAWRPREETITPSELAAENVRRALAQVAATPEGATFQRLMREPDYRSRFVGGYEEGRGEGMQAALAAWAEDYLGVLAVVVNGLMELAGAVSGISRAAFTTTVTAWFASPAGTRVPPPQDPAFAALLARLRGGAGSSPPRPAVIDDEDEEVGADEQAADLLEAAAYADGMWRLARSEIARTAMGPVRLAYADWIEELGADAIPMWREVVAFNCHPTEQGQLVGAWEGMALVNTLRSLVEASLELLGRHPELALTAIPGLGTLESLAVDAAAGVAMDDEDD
ncbi:MAG: hypothetical protein AB7V42_00160 [Thermoleophilia bacterium]